MIALTSFATDEFVAAQMGLVQSALNHGARRVTMWRPEDLERTDFYERNRSILDHPRGAGYWLWKPYIILRELERLDPGDYLVYYDCGHIERPFTVKRSLSVLTEWVGANLGGMMPGIYLPQYGRTAKWTKGECFAVTGCDAPIFQEHPLVQAGLSVWQRHDASIAFVSEWLEWCANPAALIDDHIDPTIPDAPDFVEHRHDQSVLTLLTIKRGLKCMGSPLECHPGERRIHALIDRITGKNPAESFAHLFPGFAERFPDMV